MIESLSRAPDYNIDGAFSLDVPQMPNTLHFHAWPLRGLAIEQAPAERGHRLKVALTTRHRRR